MTNVKTDKKTLVKAVSTVIIVCVVIAAIIGLLLLFEAIGWSTLLGKIMLTLLTLFISGLFFLNSVNAIVKSNKLGTAAAVAIMICAVLYILLIWADEILGKIDAYTYFLVILSAVSIFMNLIISNYITLGKSLMELQVILYVAFGYIETTLAFLILGNPVLIDLWQIFVAAAIVAVTLYVVLKVKHKNIAHAETQGKLKNEGEFVTITKEEYERLKVAEDRLKELEREKETVIIPPVTGVGNVSGSGGTGINGNNIL